MQTKTTTCGHCGESFAYRSQGTRRYCGDECRRLGALDASRKRLAAKPRPVRTCVNCGRQWVRPYGPGKPQARCDDCLPHRERHRSVSRFGITPRQYDELLAAQGGMCAIPGCGITSETNGGRALAVDHDHTCCPDQARSCGKCVRGLLCNGHNRGLGYFHDDIGELLAAVAYLSHRREDRP